MIHKPFFFYNSGQQNLQFKQLIDDIIIDLWYSRSFANMEDIRKKKCNLLVDMSKFTSYKKILSKVLALTYN